MSGEVVVLTVIMIITYLNTKSNITCLYTFKQNFAFDTCISCQIKYSFYWYSIIFVIANNKLSQKIRRIICTKFDEMATYTIRAILRIIYYIKDRDVIEYNRRKKSIGIEYTILIPNESSYYRESKSIYGGIIGC